MIYLNQITNQIRIRRQICIEYGNKSVSNTVTNQYRLWQQICISEPATNLQWTSNTEICSESATNLQRTCNKSAANLQQICSEPATNLQRTCNKCTLNITYCSTKWHCSPLFPSLQVCAESHSPSNTSLIRWLLSEIFKWDCKRLQAIDDPMDLFTFIMTNLHPKYRS